MEPFGAGGAAVAVAGPAALAGPARGATTPTIVIIGVGIAGLTCALALQDRGVHSEIYESSGRVGGGCTRTEPSSAPGSP